MTYLDHCGRDHMCFSSIFFLFASRVFFNLLDICPSNRVTLKVLPETGGAH
jgi:hypothetical protein